MQTKTILLLIGLLVLAGGLFFVFQVSFGGSDVFNSSVIDRIARAIARAEGFYVKNSRASRNHNPGNLTMDLTGKSIGKDATFVRYATDEDGFENLRKQIWKFWGGSNYYNPSMTISEVSRVWTATVNEQAAWASTVANDLGVTTDTQIGQIV